MNERMKILKLLEEGKINAEEAARLLEAIGESEGRKRRGFFWQGMESLSDMMSDMMGMVFSTAFKSHPTLEKFRTSSKKKIEFKGISGDIEINGLETDEIVVEKDGFAKIIETSDSLIIKAISGNVKINTPAKIDLEIKGLSGDIHLNNLTGRIEMVSVSGDIVGRRLKGVFKGEFVSGDVDLEFEEIEDIEINSRYGDIILHINPTQEAEIEVMTDEGDINCELPLKDLIKKPNYLKGILNTAKAKIYINNRHGDIKLKAIL